MSVTTTIALFSTRHPRRASAARRRRGAGGGTPNACETLEHRTQLTSTLYLDYGDNWPGGVLNTTVGAIDNTTNGSNPNVDGPRLSDSGGSDYGDDITVAITSINTLLGAAAAAVRADMTEFTRRFFEPFDINVVDLVGSAGAANLNDVSTILGNNEGGPENNDTYLLIGGYLINGTDNPNSNAFSNPYGGLSTGSDINGDNDEDGTALVILSGPGAGAQFNGPQNVHEAGHAFGLEHVYRQNTGSPAPAGFGADYDMLHQSEVMSYLGYNSQGGFNVFSRFPVMDGDGSQDTLANAPTPYDDLVDDPNIGPSGIEYVTGSGANDIITITKATATTATVSLQSFNDTAYTNAIDFPGSTGTTYSYTINTDRPLTIDAGGRNDRIVIDGDLGNTITLRGMHGTDELRVMGKNAGSGVYTTGTNSDDGIDGNDDLRGSVQIGSTVINFQEFEPTSRVVVQDVVNLTFRTGGSDDVVTNTPGVLQGTSGGVDIVPLSYSNVQNLTIDTATNDGASANDTVTLDAAPIASLSKLTVNAGAGADRLTLEFNPSNPVPVGGLGFDGGGADSGEDLLVLRDGTFANQTYTASGPSSGTISLTGTGLITYTNLSPIDDSLNVANMVFNATAGPETIQLENSPIAGRSRIRSASGTFELVDFANKQNLTVNALGGGDTINLTATATAPGLVNLTVNGGDGADAFNVATTTVATTLNGDGAADIFGVQGTGTASPLAVNGGTGADTIAVTGAGLSAGGDLSASGGADNDTFDVTSSPAAVVNIDGGGAFDTLKVDGQMLTYGLSGAAFTNAGHQPINYVLIELLDLTRGTFTVTGDVGPNVRVHSALGAATVDGVGRILGTLTADPGGTVAPGTLVPGTLGAGTTTLNAGSTFAVDLNGMAQADHDILNVTGAVAINNATLAGTVGAATVPGDEFLIIRNDGADPVVGQFAEGFMVEIGGKKFTVDYAFVGDADGQANDVALIRYGAELAQDPCDPSLMALFVSATSTDDQITVLPVTGSRRLRVVIENGSFTDEFGPFDFKGQTIVMGQNGHDVISTEAVPSRDVLAYGNAGNDTIRTGNNNGILLGNAGNDTLVGGNARDLLIGGAGADELTGDNAGDILVAAATKYDATGVDALANRQALCEVMHTWQQGGRASSLLNAATVFDDLEVDVLSGGHGVDWFIVDLNDVLSDRAKNEAVSDL